MRSPSSSAFAAVLLLPVLMGAILPIPPGADAFAFSSTGRGRPGEAAEPGANSASDPVDGAACWEGAANANAEISPAEPRISGSSPSSSAAATAKGRSRRRRAGATASLALAAWSSSLLPSRLPGTGVGLHPPAARANGNVVYCAPDGQAFFRGHDLVGGETMAQHRGLINEEDTFLGSSPARQGRPGAASGRSTASAYSSAARARLARKSREEADRAAAAKAAASSPSRRLAELIRGKAAAAGSALTALRDSAQGGGRALSASAVAAGSDAAEAVKGAARSAGTAVRDRAAAATGAIRDGSVGIGGTEGTRAAVVASAVAGGGAYYLLLGKNGDDEEEGGEGAHEAREVAAADGLPGGGVGVGVGGNDGEAARKRKEDMLRFLMRVDNTVRPELGVGPPVAPDGEIAPLPPPPSHASDVYVEEVVDPRPVADAVARLNREQRREDRRARKQAGRDALERGRFFSQAEKLAKRIEKEEERLRLDVERRAQADERRAQVAAERMAARAERERARMERRTKRDLARAARAEEREKKQQQKLLELKALKKQQEEEEEAIRAVGATASNPGALGQQRIASAPAPASTLKGADPESAPAVTPVNVEEEEPVRPVDVAKNTGAYLDKLNYGGKNKARKGKTSSAPAGYLDDLSVGGTSQRRRGKKASGPVSYLEGMETRGKRRKHLSQSRKQKEDDGREGPPPSSDKALFLKKTERQMVKAEKEAARASRRQERQRMRDEKAAAKEEEKSLRRNGAPSEETIEEEKLAALAAVTATTPLARSDLEFNATVVDIARDRLQGIHEEARLEAPEAARTIDREAADDSAVTDQAVSQEKPRSYTVRLIQEGRRRRSHTFRLRNIRKKEVIPVQAEAQAEKKALGAVETSSDSTLKGLKSGRKSYLAFFEQKKGNNGFRRNE